MCSLHGSCAAASFRVGTTASSKASKARRLPKDEIRHLGDLRLCRTKDTKVKAARGKGYGKGEEEKPEKKNTRVNYGVKRVSFTEQEPIWNQNQLVRGAPRCVFQTAKITQMCNGSLVARRRSAQRLCRPRTTTLEDTDQPSMSVSSPPAMGCSRRPPRKMGFVERGRSGVLTAGPAAGALTGSR